MAKSSRGDSRDSRFGYVAMAPVSRADVTAAYRHYLGWCEKLGAKPASLHRYEAIDQGARVRPPIGWTNNRS